MSKDIKEYLPKKEADKLIQVKVPVSFHNEVNSQRVDDKVSWNELIVACLQRYLDERKKQAS